MSSKWSPGEEGTVGISARLVRRIAGEDREITYQLSSNCEEDYLRELLPYVGDCLRPLVTEYEGEREGRGSSWSEDHLGILSTM